VADFTLPTGVEDKRILRLVFCIEALMPFIIIAFSTFLPIEASLRPSDCSHGTAAPVANAPLPATVAPPTAARTHPFSAAPSSSLLPSSSTKDAGTALLFHRPSTKDVSTMLPHERLRHAKALRLQALRDQLRSLRAESAAEEAEEVEAQRIMLEVSELWRVSRSLRHTLEPHGSY
jgi:hypothetical protein